MAETMAVAAPAAATNATPAKLTAGAVQVALRARHAPPEWAYFTEVRDATGAGAARSADGLAMSLWPSKGLEVHGFEIKVARADWLRELDSPGKADAIAQYCDRWWIVAPKKVVKAGELPRTWGLLEVTDAELAHYRIRVAVHAPKLTPEPLDRAFLASVLRKAAAASVGAEELAAARKDGMRDGEREAGYKSAELQRTHDRLVESIAHFEAQAGVQLSAYNGPALAEAYKIVQTGGAAQLERRLAYLADEAERISRSARELLSADGQGRP